MYLVFDNEYLYPGRGGPPRSPTHGNFYPKYYFYSIYTPKI